MQAFILLVAGHRRRILHAEYLINRFASGEIIFRKPPLSIMRAGVFMKAPVWTGSRVFLQDGGHASLLVLEITRRTS
jgi:hypothetical protein